MIGLKDFGGIQTSSNLVTIVLSLLLFSLPFLYAKIMHKNALRLETDPKMESYKTIYQNRNLKGDKKIWLYPLMFFLRRFFFIAATVFLFERPEM